MPAGCTGKAQPADVILQRPFKAGIVNEFTRWMTMEIHLMVKGGARASEVRVNTGMPTLKPKLVTWTWASWANLRQRKEMIVKGWEVWAGQCAGCSAAGGGNEILYGQVRRATGGGGRG